MKETAYAFPAPIADPMIRALLDGRKTQIRIPVKRQPIPHHWKFFKDYKLSQYILKCQDLRRGGTTLFVQWVHQINRAFDKDPNFEYSPLGAPGDRVWFRETYGLGSENNVCHKDDEEIFYRATDPGWQDANTGFRWRSSRTMPRHLSRITREIVSVRVERVQEITPSDACSEGAAEILNRPYGDPLREEAYARGKWIPDDEDSENGDVYAGSVDAFAALWNRAHGPGAFEMNPLVWVYEVK